MGYTRQTWQDNDPLYPVSAARMTHIEDGLEQMASALRSTLAARPAAHGQGACPGYSCPHRRDLPPQLGPGGGKGGTQGGI